MKVTLHRFLPSVLRIGHLNGVIAGNQPGSLRPNSGAELVGVSGPPWIRIDENGQRSLRQDTDGCAGRIERHE
jgi:hypothetical protein